MLVRYINRHSSRIFSKMNLRGRSRAGASRGGAGPEPLQSCVKYEKLDKYSGAI